MQAKDFSPIKTTRSKVSAQGFKAVMHKLMNAQVDNKTACAINRVNKLVKKTQEEIYEAYNKEITEVFGQKDEQGKVIFDEQGLFKVIEGKEEEMQKVQKEFGEVEVTVDCLPLNSLHLKDVKMSAADIDALDNFYTEQAGPGLPGIF